MVRYMSSGTIPANMLLAVRALYQRCAAAVTPVAATPGTRFLFVDGLRGVAATMVVVFHFTVAATDASHPFISGLPAWVVKLLNDGQFGVEIFFVISGFVIAYSQRQAKVTTRYFLNFALRRSFRLDPPYWFTVFLEVFILAVSAKLVHSRTHDVPSADRVLAHLTYLQELLGYREIVPVFWTLCLEVQFYVLFTLVRGLASWKSDGLATQRIEGGVMAMLSFLSLAVFCQWIPNPLHGLFLPYWFLFFLGVTVWWAVGTPQRANYFWVMCAAAGLTAVFRHDVPMGLGVSTAAAIFFAAKLNRMGSWLSGWPIQFLGRISYSLYLIHVVIGTRVILFAARFTGTSVGAKLIGVVFGIVASIVAATLMYVLIEQPWQQLSKRWLKGGGTPPRKAVCLTTTN
jgi:peptidoglycan/LPS O-acetylase OafA/YrhL